MNGRERVEAALSAAGAGQDFPVVICYEDIYIRDHWAQLTDCPWWYALSPAVDHQLQWRQDAIRAIGQDWFALPLCAPRAVRDRVHLEAHGDYAIRTDTGTGRTETLRRPRVGGWDASGRVQSEHPANPPSTKAEVDGALPLQEDADPATMAAEGCADFARALLEGAGRDLYPIVPVHSPLWSCYHLWGFERLMEAVALDPGLVRHACERLLARAVRKAQLAAAAGARGIWIEECMTDMVSPAAFEELNLPFLRGLVRAIRAAGLHSVYYYCGDPADRYDALLSAGADALSLEETKKGFAIDIEEVGGRTAGRAALLGNLDAVRVLERGSADDLRREIARQMDAGRRNSGRFVMSLGSPVTPDTPAERVRLYCGLARELCRA